MDELADGKEDVEEDEVGHDKEEEEGEERGGGGEERDDWGECWATVGVGEDTPLSPQEEAREEEEGNWWSFGFEGGGGSELVEEENGFLGFGATSGGVLLPARGREDAGGGGPLHGWSAKSAGGETRTLSRAGEGGDSCVVQALGGSTTSLLVAASPISGAPLSYTGWFHALT